MFRSFLARIGSADATLANRGALLRSTALVGLSVSIAIAALSIGSVPAVAAGGNTSNGGSGGADNPTGTGGQGADGIGGIDGGGGGGAGVTGGAGGNGIASPAHGGTAGAGGPGGAVPGQNGTDGLPATGAESAGGGGGGGGAHGGSGSNLPVATSTGGDGGAGGAGTIPLGAGGAGGAGGFGYVVTGSGSLGSLGNSVTGGHGGAGGIATALGGNGGTGGTGLFFNAAGATVTIDAAVTGGDGGAHGTSGNIQGVGGAGGAGIIGSSLAITIGTGSVSGGLADNGTGARANAITFTGGANSLSFSSGTSGLNGGVSVTGSLDLSTTNAGGTTIANVISGNGSVTKSGARTIVLSGTNTYTGTTTVNAGALTLTGSITSNVTNNATFNNTGTITGTVNNTGTVNASSGAINGAITNTGAFNVSGAITSNNTFTNNGTGTLSVAGGNYTGMTTITNNSTAAAGIVVSAGRTLSATNIANGTGATFTNNGTASGTLTSNTGTVNNNQTWLGFVNNSAGGTFNNTAPGAVTGLVTNANGGNVTTAGTLINGLNNFGLVFAQGTINNGIVNNGGGGITITGTLLTNSTVNNAANATIIVNNQSFTGVTTYTNAGNTLLGGGGAGTIGASTFNNSGALTVFSANNVINGSLNNTGKIDLLGTTLGASPALTVTGSLVMSTAATYVVLVNPTTATFVSVTGAATLNGATVSANYAAGSYVAKRYTILTAAGGLGGSTFGGVVATGQPANMNSTLSYDANNAYLNLNLSFNLPGGTLNQNQQAVANALTGYFNSNGGIPMAFASLNAGQLTQSDGELGTGSQQTTFNAMNQFMGVLTDPFIAGRGDPLSAGGSATGYADEQAMAYAQQKRNPNDALAAIYTKAPPVRSFEQRWSVWAAGYGGSQTTSGNAVVGSNDTRSSIYGTAVGADYRLSPDTLAGFALAGGGTNFSVANNLGSGRSDLFQAGAFIRHNIGAAYLSGALAYGWQDITTNRTLTISGIDQLRAQFNANAWSGRVEGGYRFVSQGLGWTPYAAGQFTTFDLPNYAEQAIVGANTFALAYNARSVTDTRSELGLRTDKSFAADDGVFTLRGRLAWAHDYNPDRSIAATFQTLPGASFVVNGARQASDSALVTAAVEKKWLNGWSAAATFEGEFSNVTTSYAGKGVVRYAW